jgi:hypothetical protein
MVGLLIISFFVGFVVSLPVLSACACILVPYLEQHIFGLQKNSKFTGEDQHCLKI